MGRTGYATIGKEAEGRVFYYEGNALALSTFKEAQGLRDPESRVLPEKTYLEQELQFCDKADKDALSSLTLAIQSFADVLRCLKTIADPAAYRSAETTDLTSPPFRVQGFPKDAVHRATDKGILDCRATSSLWSGRNIAWPAAPTGPGSGPCFAHRGST
jgi:hypothetical protein